MKPIKDTLVHPASCASEAAPRELRDPLADMLGYQLRRASWVTMAALSEALEPFGLRMTEAITIRFVAANPGCNQAEIGRALGVKRTNLVPVVAGLVTAGLIDRSPADGRTHALRLTDAGGALHRQLAAAAIEVEHRFFGDIDEAERHMLICLFQRVRAKV